MLRSVTDGSTFSPGLPRSVGTSHVLLRCNQVLLRLSSSVKVFYEETWPMNGVRAPICLRYKEEVQKAAAIYAPLIKNINTYNGNEEADFVFI